MVATEKVRTTSKRVTFSNEEVGYLVDVGEVILGIRDGRGPGYSIIQWITSTDGADGEMYDGYGRISAGKVEYLVEGVWQDAAPREQVIYRSIVAIAEERSRDDRGHSWQE